jgi:hypothetical protein
MRVTLFLEYNQIRASNMYEKGSEAVFPFYYRKTVFKYSLMLCSHSSLILKIISEILFRNHKGGFYHEKSTYGRGVTYSGSVSVRFLRLK